MRLIYLIVCFLPACMMRPVGIDGRPTVDKCNFHINSFGKGYRWAHLPVPITLHSKTINDQAHQATNKVIDEWNQVWKSESGHDQGLFEFIGWVHYNNALDIRNRDKINTIALVDREENSVCGHHRCLLKQNQQGVTSMVGMFNLSETDIFLNEEDFKFYYGEEGFQNNRNIASLAPPSSFFREWWTQFLKYLFFWKTPERDPASRQGFIPRTYIDFESLVAHELGHVLGLGHIETEGSIMRRQLGSGVMRRGLRRVELDSLLCGYGG